MRIEEEPFLSQLKKVLLVSSVLPHSGQPDVDAGKITKAGYDGGSPPLFCPSCHPATGILRYTAPGHGGSIQPSWLTAIARPHLHEIAPSHFKALCSICLALPSAQNCGR